MLKPCAEMGEEPRGSMVPGDVSASLAVRGKKLWRGGNPGGGEKVEDGVRTEEDAHEEEAGVVGVDSHSFWFFSIFLNE